MNHIFKYLLTGLIIVGLLPQGNAQINTPMQIRDVADTTQINDVVVEFQQYIMRAISYPSKANKNSISKTLYYKIHVNDNHTVSELEPVNEITDELEEGAVQLYFRAPSYGVKAKEDSDYDKDFQNAVEKAAKKFKKYKEKSDGKFQTVFYCFNFMIK